MFGWIKKRCRRRSLPPSIKQLHEGEINRARATPNDYFNFEEEAEDNVYEDVSSESSLDVRGYAPGVPDTSLYSSIMADVDSSSQEETICPLCRSILHGRRYCSCTNVYEEPCLDGGATSRNGVATTGSDHEHSSTGSEPKHVTTGSGFEHTETSMHESFTVENGLNTVYELATCPFKVPKPKTRPVGRSLSDASTRPLPKVPLSGKSRVRTEITENILEDDSSGYYESVGTDSESGASTGYSDVNVSSCIGEEFPEFSEDDFGYEDFEFKHEMSPSSRRFSLGSAPSAVTFPTLTKDSATLSHGEKLNGVTLRDGGRKNGQIFRSLKVRSLFNKPR